MSMQIIVQQARTVRGDPDSVQLCLDLNGLRRPAQVADVINSLRSLEGHAVSPVRLLALLLNLLDGQG